MHRHRTSRVGYKDMACGKGWGYVQYVSMHLRYKLKNGVFITSRFIIQLSFSFKTTKKNIKFFSIFS